MAVASGCSKERICVDETYPLEGAIITKECYVTIMNN